MFIKKFRAKSSKEALAKVKREFGPEALVVETKRLENGLCEVTAALDREESVRADPLRGVRDGDEGPRIIDEMREIKELLYAITGARGEEGEAFMALKQQMRANGIDAGITLKLLASACRTGSVKSKGRDITSLRDIVRREIGRKIMVKDPMRETRIISFIGPTGGGKTTTIAKLAAVAALKKTEKVALLTTDTRRIGAPEQLLKYGRILGIPTGVAATKADVSAFIKKQDNCRYIFIDTPGSHTDKRDYMGELNGLLSIIPELKFNLVLSVRERDESLYESVRGFSELPVDAITFTKLDESRVFGQMFGVSRRAKWPISYLGTGQKVPGDLMPATVKRVLNYLMPA